MLFLRLFLSMTFLFFIGYPPVYYLLVRKSPLSDLRGFDGKAFVFFISFYTGIMITSIYLMVLSIASVALSLQAVLIFSSVFFVFSVYLLVMNKRRTSTSAVVACDTCHDVNDIKNKDNYNRGKKNISRIYSPVKFFSDKRLLNLAFAFVMFLIAVDFLVVVFFTYLFPIRFWDAISCWSLKGRAFFMDGSILPFFTGHSYSFAHPSYPLYIPLLQTWIYIWLGAIDETLVKTIFPVFYLSLIFIFYYVFRRKFNRLFSATLVFILSTLPVVMDHGYIEYTNLVFSIILFLGTYFFYKYIKSGQQNTGVLALSALFFAILTQARTEGIIFLVVFLLINTVMAVIRIIRIRRAASVKGFEHRERPDMKQLNADFIISIILPPVLSFMLMLPWFYLKSRLGLSTFSTEWTALFTSIRDLNLSAFEVFDITASFNAVIAELFYSSFDSARAFLGSSYGAIWFIMLVIFLVNFKNYLRDYNWILLLFILAGFISLVISFSMIGEFIWSADRYLLHLLPLTYFWIFYNLPLFKNRDRL